MNIIFQSHCFYVDNNRYSKTLVKAFCLSVCSFLLVPSVYADDGVASAGPGAKVRDEVDVRLLNTDLQHSVANAGEITATHTFWVESTARILNLSCVVSNLSVAETKPGKNNGHDSIVLDTGSGCRIEVPSAISSIAGSSSRIAPFNKGEKLSANKERLRLTDYVTFQTTDGAKFQQDVYVTVRWNKQLRMQPSGEYQGVVKLIAEIPNETSLPR